MLPDFSFSLYTVCLDLEVPTIRFTRLDLVYKQKTLHNLEG